jgi:hypothetical protein
MWKKLLILSLSITLVFCIAPSMTPVDAGGRSIPINWRVAGSIVDVKTTGDPVDQNLIRLKAVGAPGHADLTVVGYAGDPVDPPMEGCDIEIPFVQDEFVAVFTDLSMLFARLMDGGDSYVCINFLSGTTFKFDMEIIGGTGRFDGATGYFTATGVGIGQYFEGPLSAESGRFIGTIEFD